MSEKRKILPKLYFGWQMNIVTSIITGLGFGFTGEGFSALFKPLSSDLGLSRAATSVASSIRGLEFGIMAPITGWLVDRFGPKWIVITGLVLMGCGMIWMNFVGSALGYYIVWGVIVGIGSTLALTIAVDKALTDWFVRKRGLAIAVRFGLIGLVSVIILPIITWLITVQGWRNTCVIWGVLMLASIPFMWVFIRQKRPEYYGLLPDGADVEPSTDSDSMIDKGVEYASDVQENEFTLKEAMKTTAFWMMIIANSCGTIIQWGFTLHCIPFITDMGISPTAAGGMMAMMVFFTIPARFFSGFFADRIPKNGLHYMMAAAFLCQVIGMTSFLLGRTIAMVFVFLILQGFGSGMTRPLLIIIRGRYFGRKAYGSIEGISCLFETPLGLLAPVYAGWVYDTTGNYITAFTIFAILAAVAAFLMCLVRPPALIGAEKQL
ncbi:MFS transporter [Thermodesulfobacteriota bacterium]